MVSMATTKKADSPDFDFRHHLYDTILLLGGKKRIADLVKKSLDYGITDSDLQVLRNYNTELITLAKERLAHLNTLKLITRPE